MKANGFKLTKKGVIALSLVAILLAGAIYLNIRLSKAEQTDGRGGADNAEQGAQALKPTGAPGETKPVSANPYASFFVDFRDERNVVRAKEIEYLRMIIAEETTDGETLKSAQDRLMELVSNMEKEFSIESQIRAKGFLDAAVTFRNGAINVVIDGESLTDEEVARILDIVMTETGAPASAVKISLSRSKT